jgi:signal transduction histidine kinase
MIRHQAEKRQLESEKQQALTRAILETQEIERRRLAQDLHDSVGQVLSAVKLNVGQLERSYKALVAEPEPVQLELFQHTRELVNDSIQEIRNIIRDILPPMLRDFGLVGAVRELCEKIERNTVGLSVHFSYDGTPFRCRRETEVYLYRVVQELFNNALKHADARTIEVHLVRNQAVLSLQFTDDGRGFNPAHAASGAGLKGIEGRVQLLRGTLSLRAAPGQGTDTHIVVRVDELEEFEEEK